MRQKSFSSGFEKHRKQTRKEKFLEEMDRIIPWKELSQSLEPYYPNPQGAEGTGANAAHLPHADLAGRNRR